MMSASKTLKKNLSIAVTAVFLAVAAFACWAIEPSKAYADNTDSHLTVASEVHVLVDSEGNVTIPNATVTNDGTCAAYIMGCSSPDGLGWTCDAVGKRIEVGQSITATWRSAGPVSDEIAAQLGEEPYYAGNLTYTYTDGDLKGTVSLDNTDPTVGDTITATVTGANVPEDKLTYQWVKVKDGSETSIDGATGSTYTATDDDAGYELVCKVSSTDDICQGTICGATGAVKKIQAFAVYSADDGSLNFYRRAIAELPSAGEQFEGKAVAAVFNGFETETPGEGNNVPWSSYSSNVKTVTVADEGIAPISTFGWFCDFTNVESIDLSKLNTSNVTDMTTLFAGCSALTSLDLSSFDTANVVSMTNLFADCSALTSLDLSSFDTSNVTDMTGLFAGCSALTSLNLSSFDTSNVGYMTTLFEDCSALTSLDLSSFDTSNITDMTGLFAGCSKLQEIAFGADWEWTGTDGLLPTPSSAYITGADGKWYDTDGNGYAPEDIPSNKAMTYTAVAPKTAFAVYSADDGSLNFYKRAEVPKQGTMYLGKRATAVYTGLENMTSIPGWMLNYSKDIKTAIVYDEGISPIGTGFWFAELRNMKTADVSKLDMSKCKTIGCMFTSCTSLTTLDLSAWDTRSLTDMNQAFQNCTSLTKLNVSGWDVSKVTNMDLVFSEDKALSSLDLSTWDNSSVTSMKDAFSMMNSLSEVSLGSKFKFVGTNPFLPDQTGHVAGADGKWYDTDGNGYAPADIPSNKAMTYYASKDLLPKAFAVYSDDDQSLNFYKRSAVPAAGEQFEGKTATATYTGIEDTNGSVSWSPWFKYESSIKTATVVDDGIQPKSTACWFYACAHMTQCDISKLDTSKVTNMNRMFRGCYSLTALDVSSFDTSKVTNMIDMFCGCSKLTALDVLSFDTSNVVNMNRMFNGCSSLTSLDLSSFDTNNVTDMNNMFSYCPNLTTVGDLSGWNVSNLTDATSMFNGCSSLTSLDLSSFDTSNVTYMRNMFQNCPNLTTVGDLSSWDTSNVTDTSYMFTDCSKLTTLDLSSWNTSKVTTMRSMFEGSFRLSVNCSNWDVSKVSDHKYFNSNAPGVILPSAWQTSSDEDVEDSAIAPLGEEHGNGDVPGVASENDNDKTASKTDGEASADSETEGNATTSATDEAGAKEETSDDIVQEEPTAA